MLVLQLVDSGARSGADVGRLWWPVGGAPGVCGCSLCRAHVLR